MRIPLGHEYILYGHMEPLGLVSWEGRNGKNMEISITDCMSCSLNS